MIDFSRIVSDPVLSCVFLTHDDNELLDPTGAARVFLRSIDRHGTPTPVPRIFRETPDIASELSSIYRRNPTHFRKHQEYVSWSEQFLPKIGSQGATFPLEELVSSYRTSYSLARRSIHVTPLFKAARDLLIRMIRACVDRFGYPQPSARCGTIGTAAALPTMGHKGDFLAETVGFHRWRHPTPILPGERNMRRKHRCINQAATSDVRYIEGILDSVRRWLAKYLPDWFGAWSNPTEIVNPTLSTGSGRLFFVETDFHHCDESFSLAEIQELVLPVYEVLVPDHMEFMRFANAVEELFEVPVYFGDFLLTGLHNAFSGQNIVSDFETIYDVELMLLGALACSDMSQCLVHLCLGDDIIAGFRTERASRIAFDAIVHHAQYAGQMFEMEKCGVGHQHPHFLKRLYYPGLPSNDSVQAGAYPGVLAWNSIFQPERFQKRTVDQFVAYLMRCDNMYGSPYFAEETIGTAKFLDKAYCKFTQSDLESANVSDWWSRLYGITWSYRNSRSLQLLCQQKLISIKS